jgi:hypothetical protein
MGGEGRIPAGIAKKYLPMATWFQLSNSIRRDSTLRRLLMGKLRAVVVSFITGIVGFGGFVGCSSSEPAPRIWDVGSGPEDTMETRLDGRNGRDAVVGEETHSHGDVRCTGEPDFICCQLTPIGYPTRAAHPTCTHTPSRGYFWACVKGTSNTDCSSTDTERADVE